MNQSFIKKKIRKINRYMKWAAYDSFWMIGIVYILLGWMIYSVFTHNYVFEYVEEKAHIVSVDSKKVIAELEVRTNVINDDYKRTEADLLWYFEDDDTRYMAQWAECGVLQTCLIEIPLNEPLSYQQILENRSKKLRVLIPTEKVPLWHRIGQYLSFD